MLQCIQDCLGWRQKSAPLVISSPLPALRPLSLQPPRRAPMRPDMLPPLNIPSVWSLHDAINRPITPVVTLKPAVGARFYRRSVVQAAFAPVAKTEMQRPPPPLADLPHDIGSDEVVNRLPYTDKGKWPAHRPPTPKSLDLPEMSLDGHQLSASSNSDYSQESDSSSQTITFEG